MEEEWEIEGLRNLTAAAAGVSSRSETESCHLSSAVAFPPGNTSAVLYSSEIQS
jgi:hypothetical protein